MFLNVEAALKDKNPKLYKKIPDFAIRWVERLIHQDAMNGFMEDNIKESSVNFATNAIDFFQAKVKVVNEQYIPKTGRSIVVCNHPLGGLDGLALISVIGKYRSDMKFPVNDLLMQITPMRDIFVPVNKHGWNQQDSIKQLNDIFDSDDLVLYFPAGLCSRKHRGKICDLEWKKTFISKAKEFKRDVVPAYFDGRNSNRFYNIATLRKKLNIKVNVEMLFLPDETFRQKGKVLTVTFGPSIPYTQFDDSRSDKEWAEWVKGQVYALGNR